MTKVLYICPSTGIGGAETFLKQTFNNADKEQFENHYLLFRSGPLYDALTQRGAQVHLLKKVPRLSQSEDRKLVSTKIKELINTYNFDLVHSTMAYSALFAAWPCKQMNTPHVWFQHGPASGWMDRLAAILPHQGLIVNSHFTGKTQRRLENPVRFFIPRRIPIEKILLGTDIRKPTNQDIAKQRQDILGHIGLPPDTLLISMLCRIQEWKGVHLLIEALQKLKVENFPRKIHMVVWGEAFKSTDYFDSLKNLVETEKLPVSFLGRTDNAALSLAATDIVVNASIQPEPFGLSIIEGMMVGTVPLVPDKGGPVEIVSNGKNGLHFKTGQVPSLVRQLKTLLSDQELREKLSQQAEQTAQNKFTAGRAIQHLEKFYLKVLNNK